MSESYRPLTEISKTMRVKWYRSPIDREALRKLTERSNAKGWFQALGHLLLAAAAATAVYMFYTRQIWVGFGVSLFVYGTIASFFMLATHELGHGTVFRTKWLNQVFLRFYSLLAWHNHHDYAVSHTYHHRYTLHPEGDREVVLPKNPSLRVLYMLQLFTINIYGGFESHSVYGHVVGTVKTAFRAPLKGWVKALYEAHPEQLAKSVRFARLTLLFHVAVLAVSIATGYWLIGVLVSFSFCIANWLRYFVGVPMHCGLRDNVADFRKCVRTISLDPISEFLYWRMNWHMEHHMYAAVPCYNLRKLHVVIETDVPKRRTFLGAWKEMREIWKRQQTEPDYQFDTPLPPGAGRLEDAGKRDAEELRSSIGDLAAHEA